MLIGLVGKAGSGKTTIGDYLVQRYDFNQLNFADSLKEIGKVFGYTHKQLYGSQSDKDSCHPIWKVSARVFLQRVGTELFRNQFAGLFPECSSKRSVWIDIVADKLTDKTVIADVRFSDEAKFIKQNGGILIRVSRKTDFNYDHVSETELSGIECDFTIENNGSLNELYDKVALILN